MGIWRRPSTALALGSLVFLSHASLFIGAFMDDAYISFRYAQNLVAGLGLVYNAGERVEGFTNLSWTLLSALSLWLGLDPELTMPLLGTLSGVLLVIGAVRASGRFAGESSAGAAGLFAGLLVAGSTTLSFYAVSGLEETCFAWLFCLAALALVERRLYAFALWLSLAFLTRPEAGLLGVLAVLLLAREARSRLCDGERAWALGLLGPLSLVVALVGPWLAFKLIYFGDLLPNTLRAKSPAFGPALHYTAMSAWPLAGLFVLAGRAFVRKELSRAQAELALIALSVVLACVVVGPDWMPAQRLLAPAVAPLAIVVGSSLGSIGSSMLRTARGGLLVLALLVYFAAQLEHSASLAKSSASWPERDALSRKLAAQLRARERSFATINIGLLGYAAPELRVLDLVGLVDRHIAARPGGHLKKNIDDAYLAAHAPDVYVLTSSQPAADASGRGQFVPDTQIEGDLFARPWFLREYQYAGTVRFYQAHYYHLFRRRR